MDVPESQYPPSLDDRTGRTVLFLDQNIDHRPNHYVRLSTQNDHLQAHDTASTDPYYIGQTHCQQKESISLQEGPGALASSGLILSLSMSLL
jgi:hypothetical protein